MDIARALKDRLQKSLGNQYMGDHFCISLFNITHMHSCFFLVRRKILC